MDHILSVDQFDRSALEDLFKRADAMRALVKKDGGDARLAHHVTANLFYEPSTRTSSSFAAAMYRLGGQVISINDVQYSSVAKGETLEDTVRTLGQYADAIVLRHPEVGASAIAAGVSKVPIINAGDGIGEHPTQALLDLYTILSEFGQVDGLTITLVGDLKNGRTVHSLAKLLNHFDVTLRFVAPESLKFPDELAKELTNKLTSSEKLDELKDTDILYVTRVQKERFANLEVYEAVKNSYIITNDTLTSLKPTARIMHPLPRVGEIASEVDSDPRAAYFRQVENGLYIRMVLFDMLIKR